MSLNSVFLVYSSTPTQPAWEWKNSEDAVKAYTALLGFLALGQIPALRGVKFIDFPYFIGLASMTIYIGAHRGLCTKVRQQITIKEVRQRTALDAAKAIMSKKSRHSCLHHRVKVGLHRVTQLHHLSWQSYQVKVNA